MPDRKLEKDDLTILPYYPWSWRLSRSKKKATEFQVCFTARDGYRILQTFSTRRKAQKYIDNFEGE